MAATFTTGLMGSGKSRFLIHQYGKDSTKKIAFAVHLTEQTGTRGTIESRNGKIIECVYLNKDQGEEIIQLVRTLIHMTNIDSIYIDEIQFLPPVIIPGLLNLSEKNNVETHFFGLSTTFTSEYFDASKILLDNLPLENIIRIPMICQTDDCSNNAEYNARIVNGKVKRSGETFLQEKSSYLSVCEKCYFK
jgi:thymidine kinase